MSFHFIFEYNVVVIVARSSQMQEKQLQQLWHLKMFSIHFNFNVSDGCRAKRTLICDGYLFTVRGVDYFIQFPQSLTL